MPPVINRQYGNALIISVLSLLLLTLGFFAMMRVVRNDVLIAGALSWHNRGKQISEIALSRTITDVNTASEGIPLEFLPDSTAWLRRGSNLSTPNNDYWASCSATNSDLAKRCEMITMGNFKVYRAVQTTTVVDSSSTNSCFPSSQIYYKVYLHLEEVSGNGAQVDTETVYWLCAG